MKLGRAIWVVLSWFLSAVIAAVASACVAWLLVHLEVIGIVLCLTVNLVIRAYIKRRGDAHAKRVQEEAYERVHPEEFALEQEDY